jgi:hypothetical protein
VKNSAQVEDDAYSVVVTVTAQDPTKLMNKSVGFTKHTLHSSMIALPTGVSVHPDRHRTLAKA